MSDQEDHPQKGSHLREWRGEVVINRGFLQVGVPERAQELQTVCEALLPDATQRLSAEGGGRADQRGSSAQLPQLFHPLQNRPKPPKRSRLSHQHNKTPIPTSSVTP
jgi:hypothetical protein